METDPREIAAEPLAIPATIAALVGERSWHRDTVGEAGASVHRLHACGVPDLYLKHGTGAIADALTDEMVRMRWLGGRLAVPAVTAFVLDDTGAWLLMSAIRGRTAYQWLDEHPDARETIVDAIAAHLRALHALPVEDCPFDSSVAVRLADARRRIDAGLVDEEDFGDEHAGWSAEQVWEAMTRIGFTPERVVTHGDNSLDNILIDEGAVAGLIDLGRVGVADPYQDLAILWNCLGEFGDALQDRLFARCGIARPDERKLRFHLMLDEMF